MEPCPADRMKRSRSGHLGSAGSNFRKRVNSTVAMSAAPIGRPGWPDFACSTASMASARMAFAMRSCSARDNVMARLSALVRGNGATAAAAANAFAFIVKGSPCVVVDREASLPSQFKRAVTPRYSAAWLHEPARLPLGHRSAWRIERAVRRWSIGSSRLGCLFIARYKTQAAKGFGARSEVFVDANFATVLTVRSRRPFDTEKPLGDSNVGTRDEGDDG